MHHSSTARGLMSLCLLTALTAAFGSPPARSADSAAAERQTILVVQPAGKPRLVDPATGDILWQRDAGDSFALGPDGTLYVSLDRDGRTDILAFMPGIPKPVLVSDRAPAGAQVRGVSPTGDRLWLLTFDADRLPNGITEVPLSPSSTAPDERPRAYRSERGMLLSDGSRWYGGDATAEQFQLVEVRFQDGELLEATPVVLDQPASHPLLMSPDGRRIYALCYPCQTITVIDPIEGTVVRTIRFDRRLSKAPACAAVLSPSGDRLYHVALDGNASLGLDVYDTATFERVARFFPGRYFYCLAVSSDGNRLYANTMDALLTINATTGHELTSVPSESEPAPPYLGFATSSG